MAKSPVTKVDVNTGSIESLVAISGIGGALAEKIIAGRPYASLDDLTRVQGISARSVERWAPMLVVEDTDENLPVLEAEFVEEEEVIESGDDSVVEIESVEEIAFDAAAVDEMQPVIEMVDEDLIPEPVEAAQEEKPKEKKKTQKTSDNKPLLRGDAFVLGGVVGVLSVLLAVVLTLGILALVNGGLDYVLPGELSNTQRQVEMLEGKIDTITQDIDGLVIRLDSLEALGGRVADLESKTDSVAKDVADLKAELAGVEEQLDVLTKQYGIFDGFLGGMQDLLNELLPVTAPPAVE